MVWQLVKHRELGLNRLFVLGLEEGDDLDDQLLARTVSVIGLVDLPE